MRETFSHRPEEIRLKLMAPVCALFLIFAYFSPHVFEIKALDQMER